VERFLTQYLGGGVFVFLRGGGPMGGVFISLGLWGFLLLGGGHLFFLGGVGRFSFCSWRIFVRGVLVARGLVFGRGGWGGRVMGFLGGGGFYWGGGFLGEGGDLELGGVFLF